MFTIPDFQIFAGPNCIEFSEKIITELRHNIEKSFMDIGIFTDDVKKQIADVRLGKVTARKFKDGDTNIVFDDSVRRSNVILIQTFRTGFIQQDFDELCQMIETAKFCGAERVTVVIPYYPARQDRRDVRRASITAKYRARVLVECGVDAMIIIHLHNDTVAAFFDCSMDNLQVVGRCAEYFLSKGDLPWLVVAPDTGAGRKSESLAKKLRCPMGMIYKTRPTIGETEVLQVMLPMETDLKNVNTILFDDMGDSFNTLKNDVKALREAGLVGNIYCFVTHPVFTEKARENIKEMNAMEVITTDTLPLPNQYFSQEDLEMVTIISVAPMIAGTIWKQLQHKSVSQVYINT